jgi:hypothetical protein
MVAAAYRPLATPEDMRDGPFKYLLSGATDTYLASTMARASRNIESRCGRRLTPFVGAVHSELAEGVSSPSTGGGMPISMIDTLTESRASALTGSGAMVRDVWLHDHAVVWPDLWTYSDVTVQVLPMVGGEGQTYSAGVFQGPQPDSGHIRLPLGTYCPIGSTIRVTYSGGYTVAIPDDLSEACMLQAARLLILSIAPERRGGLTTADLEAEIDAQLRPYGGARAKYVGRAGSKAR